MTFAQLGLPDALVHALNKKQITEPFPVQAATIPDALDGRDVCGKAPTGSGKTLAFGLPILAKVDRAKKHRPQALILAPTRELAEQIKMELLPLAKAVGRFVAAVYGGVSYRPQMSELRRGVDVLVATPGRLEDLIEQKAINLSEVEFVVVDEADRMADMGFLPDVRRLLDRTPNDRQTMLFSATLDGDIAVLSRDYQRNPVRHEAEAIAPDTSDASHFFWLVQHEDRIRHTADVIKATHRTIVFTRTRHGADRLARQLQQHDVAAVAMHGGRSQNQRNKALREFTRGRAEALIATDVAARGIHIDAVASIVHFDPPADHKDYLHRSGRTARAGATGIVVSMVTHQQRRAVKRLLLDLDVDGQIEQPSPEHLLIDGERAKAPRKQRQDQRREDERPERSASQSGSKNRGNSRDRHPRNDRNRTDDRDRRDGRRNDQSRNERPRTERPGKDREHARTAPGDRSRDDRRDGRRNDQSRNERPRTERPGKDREHARTAPGDRSRDDRRDDRGGSDRDRNGAGRDGNDRSRNDRSRNDRGTPRGNRDRNDQGRGNDRGRASKPSKPTVGESVYIANLPWQADDRSLRDMFSPHGKVHGSSVIIDSRSGRSEGFGFVDMPKADAERAIKALNGTKLEGRAIVVRLAKPRTYGE
jgi:superfamily II DNA/RNA helicase